VGRKGEGRCACFVIGAQSGRSATARAGMTLHRPRPSAACIGPLTEWASEAWKITI
jgi:hypothetical protein